jgi:putative ABC transport system permease protein
MIWENIKMALASIWAAKMRSFLTMLGIIIGISSVVSINAIGEGVKQAVSGQITGLGSNIVTVTSGQSVTTDKNGKQTINTTASTGASTLTQSDVDTLTKVSHVRQVAPLYIISGLVMRGDRQTTGGFVIATTPAYQAIRNQKLEAGEFFHDRSGDVVVLGSKVKAQLFGDEPALGQQISIRSTKLTVIGVLKSEDTGASSLGGSGGFDSALYLPVESAKRITNNNVQILRMMVQVDDASNVNSTVTRMKETLKSNHGGQEDFSVLTQEDQIKLIGDILNVLTSFIAAIAAIALLVGGIGIMNIMLVSVSERTREIGIRKALGATRRMIRGQFLIEASVISLFGGLLGMAAAVGQGLLIGKFAKITPVFSVGSFTTAVTISVAVGIIFGLAPAIKAARKRPIDALRYE